MIQLAALPATANPVAGTAARPAAQPGETADQLSTTPETPDFASFLAAPQSGATTLTVTEENPTPDAAPAEPAPIGARAMLQQLAAALQQGGKSLPVAGKLLALTASATAPVDEAEADSQNPAPDAGTPADPANQILPDAAALPVPAAVLLLGTATTATPETPATPSQGASHRSDAAQAGTPSLSHAALPALVEAQLHGRPLTLAALQAQPDQSTIAAEQVITTDTRTITVARNAAAPVQAFTINPGAAPDQPGAVRLRPIITANAAMSEAAVTADPALSLADPSSAGSAMTMPQTVAQSAPGAPLPTPAATGHDFAKLVDRLIEARDAAAPQGIHVAMDHAVFGKVSLSFHQDAAGLSVSATSPDPDFARAVQAATPSTSADGAGAQNQSDTRQGSSQAELRQQFSGASAQSQNGSQGHTPSTDPRDNRSAANSASAADAGTGADSPTAARQRGLFA